MRKFNKLVLEGIAIKAKMPLYLAGGRSRSPLIHGALVQLALDIIKHHEDGTLYEEEKADETP